MNESPFKDVYLNLDQVLAWAWTGDAELVNVREPWTLLAMREDVVGCMPRREAEMAVLHGLQRGDLKACVGGEAVEGERFSDAEFHRSLDRVTLRRVGHVNAIVTHSDLSRLVSRDVEELSPLFEASNVLLRFPPLSKPEIPGGADEAHAPALSREHPPPPVRTEEIPWRKVEEELLVWSRDTLGRRPRREEVQAFIAERKPKEGGLRDRAQKMLVDVFGEGSRGRQPKVNWARISAK
jgi:hypothetical protein